MNELINMLTPELPTLSTKRTDMSSENPELVIEKNDGDSSISSSDLDEKSPNLSHTQKLKKMHKAVADILKKTQKTKEHLKFLRQEVEVTCEQLKNEPEELKNEGEELKNEGEELKNESNLLDISEISSHPSASVWDEIKILESQLKHLKEKVKTGEESIKNRKKQGDEIKELIHELEGLQNSRCQSRYCECKACVIL